MREIIVGVDNGLDGGLCAVAAFGGGILARTHMPTLLRGGKREIDIRSLLTWLGGLEGNPTLAIEEPLKHAASSQSMRSMGISFGKLLGMCEARSLPVVIVQVGDWQKHMLHGGKARRGNPGQTKVAALRAARALVPDEDWIKDSPRCRAAHDGMVDAFLIARYVRGKTGK
jgi:hypothetical protein